jgi:hypothetical protein
MRYSQQPLIAISSLASTKYIARCPTQELTSWRNLLEGDFFILKLFWKVKVPIA